MKTGETAPDFTLKDGEGNEWTLNVQRVRTVPLLFYPGDNTPVCIAQLCSAVTRKLSLFLQTERLY